MSDGLGGDAITRKVLFDLNRSRPYVHTKHFPVLLHHVIYASAKFEVARSNGLRGEAFTRKYIIWP